MKMRTRRSFTDAMTDRILAKYEKIHDDVDFKEAEEMLKEALTRMEEIWIAKKVAFNQEKKNFKMLSKFSKEEIEAFLIKINAEQKEEKTEQKKEEPKQKAKKK